MTLKSMFPKSRTLNPLPKPEAPPTDSGVQPDAAIKPPFFYKHDFSPEKQLKGEALKKYLAEPMPDF